jgi:hypothetical protein
MDSLGLPTRSCDRELAQRTTDGIEVTLFWNEENDVLSVRVLDAQTGAYFEIEPERDRALEAFYHPFTYAARNTAGLLSKTDQGRR